MKIMTCMTLKKAIRCGTAIAACWMVPAWLPAQELYWTEYSGEAGTVRIQTSDINGENVDTLFAPTEMASFAVDVEVTDTHIFWSGHNGGDVWRASLDGTEPPVQIIAPGEGLQSVHNLAVDESTGTLYIADQNLGIFSAGLDGSNLTNLWGTVPTLYSGIQVRSSNQILWVSRETGYLYIQELPAGPFPEAVLLEGGADIYGLAYDPVSDAVYYTSHTGGTLRSYNLTTAEHNLLKSGLHQPLGVKLSPGGNHLLIAERGKGISVFQLDNKQYKLLVEASGAHFGVAATADPAEVLPPPVGTVLWSADFEADVADGAPAANWGDVSGPDDGEAQVVKDDLNAFGFGTDNQFLRVNQVLSLGLRSEPLPVTTEVVTFSFDFIGRFKEGDGRWLQAMIYDANSYAHITSIRTGDENIRGAPDNPSYGGNDLPIRMETIFNNSAESIT